MTRRYLNPAWKNRSTEELERALEVITSIELADDEDARWFHSRRALEQEIAFRNGEAS